MKFNNLEDKCLYYRGLTDYRIQGNNDIIVKFDIIKYICSRRKI